MYTMTILPIGRTVGVLTVRNKTLKIYNNMKQKITLAICLILTLKLTSQSTYELFTLDGLAIVSNFVDDTGQLFETTTYFVKSVLIDTIEYIEYQNQDCRPTLYRVYGDKIYQKGLFWGEEETLLYDFGLQVGDTTKVTMWVHPGGLMKFDFIAIETDTVILLDGKERKRITLESEYWGGELIWVNGIGQYNFNRNIECVKDNNGSILLNVSESVCNERTSKEFTSSTSNQHSKAFKFYPNPITNEIVIEAEFEGFFKIINMLGETLIKGKLNNGINRTQIDMLYSGQYILVFESGKTVHSEKIIIKK